MESKPESGIAGALLPRNLGVRVGMLIAATILVAGGFLLYVLFARGVFEQTQRVILIADNAEGVRVGMDLTFSGFPIGTVRRITLRDDGKVRISVRVPVTEAKWLRQSSVFVLDVPLVGSAKLATCPLASHTRGCIRMAESSPSMSSRERTIACHQRSCRLRLSSIPRGP